MASREATGLVTRIMAPHVWKRMGGLLNGVTAYLAAISVLGMLAFPAGAQQIPNIGAPMIPNATGGGGGGSGTVSSVSVVTANGISGSVANPTTTPAITLTLGAIAPSSVAIGAGSAITSSGPGGVLGSNAFNSTAYAPLASPTFSGTVTMPDSSTWTSSGVAALTALGLANNAAITWTGEGIITSPAVATIQFGAANVNGAPVAQTLSFQGALAGSATNQASANTTIIGSLGTGTGTNGDTIFQTGKKTTTGSVQATATTALTIKGETQQLATSINSITVPAFTSTTDLTSGITPRSNEVDVIVGSSRVAFFGSSNLSLISSLVIEWANGAYLGPPATGNNQLELVNSTNAENFRVYNTTSSSNANYERAVFGWADTSNVLTIGTQNLGTGSARNLQFVVGGAVKGDYGVTTAANWTFVGPAAITSLANVATTSAVCYNTTSGLLTYDGTIGTCNTSDETLKTFDASMGGALSKLISISQSSHFGYFHWNDGKGDEKIGIGAQTVARYFPELVERGSDGLYSLAYDKLTVPIISALAVISGRLDAIEKDRK
jgi:hypothetical protein